MVLKVGSTEPWRSPRLFQGFCEVTASFMIILRRYLPFSQGKSKAVASSCSDSHYILHHHTRVLKFKKKKGRGEEGGEESHFHLQMSLRKQ